MSKIDYSILYLKSENARMRLKELAKSLRKSSQRLKYNLAVFEKEGILRFSYAVFDYSYFGILLFRVYFRAAYVNEKERDNIVKELSENPYVMSIYELSGEFDLVVEFAAPNPSKFNKELKKISELAPSLNNYKIVLNLVSDLAPKQYLTRSEHLRGMFSEKVVGGDRERETFNANEMKVMKALRENPTIRITTLAKTADINAKTAKQILSNLAKRNVLKGCKYNGNINKLGISKFRMFLRLHNISIQREADLMKHILSLGEAVQMNKTVGDWDLELDIEAVEKNRIRQLIMQLRENFKDIIESVNLIEFYDYYTRRFLPAYLFSEHSKTR